MNRFAPILWIVFFVVVLVYWTNGSHHQDEARAKRAVEEEPDDKVTKHFSPDFDCTLDCSGHQAGYDWAEQHDIDDEENCGGKSESFIEGCKAYVREQRGTSPDDYSANEDSEREDD